MILDTNALSAVADGNDEIFPAFSEAQQIAIPVVVLGEFRFGLVRSKRRKQYEDWLPTILAGSLILDITQETAIYYAGIRSDLRNARTPIPANDVWIAALGRQHRLPILSRDRDFDRISGIRRIEW